MSHHRARTATEAPSRLREKTCLWPTGCSQPDLEGAGVCGVVGSTLHAVVWRGLRHTVNTVEAGGRGPGNGHSNGFSISPTAKSLGSLHPIDLLPASVMTRPAQPSSLLSNLNVAYVAGPLLLK